MKTNDTKQVEQRKQIGRSDAVVDLKHGDANFADEINSRHNKIVAHGEAAVAEAIRIGELLVANKKAVRHGAWLKWLEKNIVFSDQTARNYIWIYENRDDPKFKSVLNLADAYALLADKRTARKAARSNGEQQAAVATDSESKPDGEKPEQKPKSADVDQIPTEPEETEEARWRRLLLERAQKAIRLARFFAEAPSCEPYQDAVVAEAKFTFDQELIDAAAFAAARWQKLADYLRSRRLAQEAKELFNGTIAP
jgi:hypothetical protein